METHHINKSNMFRAETQQGHSFDELNSIQHGWDFSVSQLGPSNEISKVSFYQTPHVGYNKFRYGVAYDQRLRAREGILSFGLLSTDNPTTWAYDQHIPNEAIIVFPNDEYLRAASPIGFSGNGMHFAAGYMTSLAEQVYNRPLSALIPDPGIYMPDAGKVGLLRAELRKWQELARFSADVTPAIIELREESLALAVINALIGEQYTKKESMVNAMRSVSLALDIIHTSELENISVMELCKHTKCSQRTLEKCFSKRFGTTPKKYIKCLRLAEVYKGLRNFDAHGYASIIELAGINGFWHMGQFAADYRRIYGELPSETLIRN